MNRFAFKLQLTGKSRFIFHSIPLTSTAFRPSETSKSRGHLTDQRQIFLFTVQLVSTYMHRYIYVSEYMNIALHQ